MIIKPRRIVLGSLLKLWGSPGTSLAWVVLQLQRPGFVLVVCCAPFLQFFCPLDRHSCRINRLAVYFVQVHIENGDLLVLAVEEDNPLNGIFFKPQNRFFGICQLVYFFSGEIVRFKRKEELGVEIETLIVKLDQFVDDNRGGKRPLEDGHLYPNGLHLKVDV